MVLRAAVDRVGSPAGIPVDGKVPVHDKWRDHAPETRRTYQEIAERLSISPRTEEKHVSAILVKFGVGSSGEAVTMARRLDVADG